MAPANPDPVFSRIRAAAARGALSHALLFTGPGDRLAAARFAASAFQCVGPERDRPCGVCPACRKVREDIHPDVSTVRDEEHKFIAVDVVREVRRDAYIRPNEGERKVYLFPDCALLTEQDQNVLLKLVEEGPPYAAFVFCAENPAAVLQTLRSRCVELKLQPKAPQGREEDGEGEALCRCLLRRKRGSAAELAVRLEKKKLSRENLSALLERSEALLSQALVLTYGGTAGDGDRALAEELGKRLTKTQLVRTIELMKQYRRECGYNVGPGHVLGALAAELEELF
ncbi:DNA polymerase III subunit delta' [Oscillibacter sp.]|jgi:DNA polymerase-3 subunit delta'|uniref:DNA polymerase III subunit delta' n=1 Tax=Oscillibacter sp. TaxID=1945593 RepID=UPI00216B6B94|nr:DNA polymerase III subunit delta' [Oscillibacter sp.]MCI9240435.1 DNA polymerase III subunit delta' [Oscillibacter sp.]